MKYTRSLVITAIALAVTLTGCNEESPMIRAKAKPSATAIPSATPSAEPTQTTQPQTQTTQPQTQPTQPTQGRPAVRKPTTKAAAPRPPAPKTYYMSPTTWRTSDSFSQGLLDQGKLVTWTWYSPCLIAGHNNKGWAWLDDMPNGSYVVVKTGPCAGRYKVVGHASVPYQGSPTRPAWMSKYAAIFQTCRATGSGFSLAVRA